MDRRLGLLPLLAGIIAIGACTSGPPAAQPDPLLCHVISRSDASKHLGIDERFVTEIGYDSCFVVDSRTTKGPSINPMVTYIDDPGKAEAVGGDPGDTPLSPSVGAGSFNGRSSIFYAPCARTHALAVILLDPPNENLMRKVAGNYSRYLSQTDRCRGTSATTEARQ